jgi:hypothetical protein
MQVWIAQDDNGSIVLVDKDQEVVRSLGDPGDWHLDGGERGAYGPFIQPDAHEQALPEVSTEGDSVQELVIRDVQERMRVGMERYGTLLRPFNGRDALRDLYEELLDGAMYARQVLEEQKDVLPAAAEFGRLAEYLMEHWGHEIKGDGATDLVIRLLEELSQRRVEP